MTGVQRTIRVELLLWAILVAMAAGLRLARLDWPPLTNAEASQALAALQDSSLSTPFLKEGENGIADSAVYHALTPILFDFFGASEAVARFAPALAGWLLIMAPLLLRHRSGLSAALMTGALLAFSPSLVAASRQADGLSIALAGAGFALAMLLSPESFAGHPWVVSLPIGLALASGPSIWVAIAGLGLGLLARSVGSFLAKRRKAGVHLREASPKTIWLAGLIALAIAGGLGYSMGGIGDLSTSLAEWLRGWRISSGIHPLTEVAALVLYEPLILAFGMAGAVQAFRRKDLVGRWAAWWALGAFMALLIYPGRSPGAVTWMVLPLATLAGKSLCATIEQSRDDESLGTRLGFGMLLLVLAAFTFLQLRASAGNLVAHSDFPGLGLDYAIPLAALALAAVVLVLFGLGWSWRLALHTAGVSASVVLFAFSLSSIWRLSFGSRAASAQELWRPQASTAGLPLMEKTLSIASQAYSGQGHDFTIQVLGKTPDAVVWTLREFRRAGPDDLASESSIPAAIAPESQPLPASFQGYDGQTLAVGEHWGWEGALPPQAMAWMVGGKAPVVMERWIILVDPLVFRESDDLP